MRALSLHPAPATKVRNSSANSCVLLKWKSRSPATLPSGGWLKTARKRRVNSSKWSNIASPSPHTAFAHSIALPERHEMRADNLSLPEGFPRELGERWPGIGPVVRGTPGTVLPSHHTSWEGSDASHWNWIRTGRVEITPVALVEELETSCLSQQSMVWTTRSVMAPR